MTSNPKERI